MAEDSKNGFIFRLSGAQVIGFLGTLVLIVPAIFWAATLWHRVNQSETTVNNHVAAEAHFEAERRLSRLELQITDIARLEVSIAEIDRKIEEMSGKINKTN